MREKRLGWLFGLWFFISVIASSHSGVASVYTDEKQNIDQFNTMVPNVDTSPEIVSQDPVFEIIYPQAGFLYVFHLQPLKLPNYFHLGCAVVVGRTLVVETNSQQIHHAKFVSKRLGTGWETTQWDYTTINGLSFDLGLSSGMYTIWVYGYDENNVELGSDLIKVLFIQIGREDFGVWINTRYDTGPVITTPLNIGLLDFGSMLNTGESKRFTTTMQSKDDTYIEIRFTRTKITENLENVVQTQFTVETSCDTSKEYQVSLDVRFPFVMLAGGEPKKTNNPYFRTQVGYRSTSVGGGINKVASSFFVGRDYINDPRVFRLKIEPNTVEVGSSVSFFTQYAAFDEEGYTVFQRMFSLDFDPATELTVTTIPSQGRISYDFGRSAGTSTRVSFRAEGGVLDDIIQSFQIDPLPSYMNFDLTVIGSREFLYESDRMFNVSYSLDSVQNGNLVRFVVGNLPKMIHASWGVDLGVFGDLTAGSFLELNMSSDVEEIALFFSGNPEPFITFSHLPNKIRCESFVDVIQGTGDIRIRRESDAPRVITVCLSFDTVKITKSYMLSCSFVQLSWDIQLTRGVGCITLERDAGARSVYSTVIEYNNWVFSKTVEFENSFVSLSWDVNRQERRGHITALRNSSGGNPIISFAVSHGDWTISDSFELKNERIELLWDLPDTYDTHGVISLFTGGGTLLYTTLCVQDAGCEILRVGLGIQAADQFRVSWDRIDGQIRNVVWSGRIFSLEDLDIVVNLTGDVFRITADLSIGENGMLQLMVNRNVEVTFADTSTPVFKLFGSASLYAQRKLLISWSLSETGYFTVHTFGQPLGDAFTLEFGFDPAQMGNYRYGFRLTGQNFIAITRTVQWHAQNGNLIRVWILGDMPLPGDWTLQLLWNYQWYTVPWP